MDLGLLQREVAQKLGIHPSTYCNWEAGQTEPETRYLPTIHAFLSFCPFDAAWTLGERLRAAREAQGLSLRTAARLVGVDPGTIARVEAGRVCVAQTKSALDRLVRRKIAGTPP